MSRLHVGLVVFLAWVSSSLVRSAEPTGVFVIRVVDQATGRGVPLVELRTTNEVRFVSDSNGVVAFAEPGLMGQDVFFHVRSHGYEFPKDAFGYRGLRLKPTPGGTATIKVKRLNVAERLYRVTGQGVYRDSTLAGLPVPVEQPLLNAQVAGQDSVQAAVYHGKIFWLWGDTNRTAYPLGNFGSSGATSELPGKPGGLDPSVGVNLRYFADPEGFARAMVPESALDGPGPRWLSGLTVLPDPTGRDRLVARYMRVKTLGETLERGLVVFNDQTGTFDRLVKFDVSTTLGLEGHPFRAEVDGVDYLYGGFGPPYWSRVRVDWQAVQDPAAAEGFSCLAPGGRFDGDRTKLDRGPDGKLVYAWKKDTPPLTFDQQERLVRAGLLKREEAWVGFRDVDTGKPVKPHGGSVSWSPYRRRWFTIFTQSGGSSSLLGEIWYAEADTPNGPWLYAKKVLTHDRYTFYNPTHHPFFDQDGGRRIYFEGTYTADFSGNPEKTPRYEYNQVMYRLDLADPRLSLPAPVYRANGKYLTREATEPGEEVAFFAVPPGRTGPGLAPVYATAGEGGVVLDTRRPETVGAEPVFLAASDRSAPGVVPLTEYRSPDGGRRYSTSPPGPDWRPVGEPVCHVWERPAFVPLPDRGASPR